jgi:uncharacterized protein YlxW (UPF0749 family)
MHFWTAIVVLALISAAVKIVQARHGVASGCQRRVSELEPENDRLREEVSSLKDRIAVLERITTENDRALTLDREIEQLRRQPAK